MVHTPFTQVASAFGNAHALPQAPQLARSLFRSTHLTPHLSGVAAGHVDTQLCVLPELAHKGASAPHAVAQPPHDSGRVMLVSQPSSGADVQWAKPSLQPAAGMKHLPWRH